MQRNHHQPLTREPTMQANKFCEFGPGDSATWPPCENHPHDPRTPEAEDEDCIADVRDFLDIAESAAMNGDLGKARLSLEDLVGAEQ